MTCLLEKKFGSIYADKLWAICLFEADFKSWCKLFIAKRIMGTAAAQNAIPLKIFSRPGHNNLVEAPMSRILSNDIHRTLHIPFMTDGVDLRNGFDTCHDAEHRPPSLSSPVSHDTTDASLSAADEKGVTAPLPRYVVVLMINSYKRQMYGVRVTSCWLGAVFMLASLMYVDNTDLLLQVQDLEQLDAEFFAQIQRAVAAWGNIVQVTEGYLKQEK